MATVIETWLAASHVALRAMLAEAFGCDLGLVDGHTGELLYTPPEQSAADWAVRGELARAVAQRGQPEFIEDDDPLVTLALPLDPYGEAERVAVGTFLTRPVGKDECPLATARLLGLDARASMMWLARQAVWSPSVLLRFADMTRRHLADQCRIEALQREAQELTTDLAGCYREVSLLHHITRKINVAQDKEELGRIALSWLLDVLPAEAAFIRFQPPAEGSARGAEDAQLRSVLSVGRPMLGETEIARLLAHVVPNPQGQPVIVSAEGDIAGDWPLPQVRQLMMTPLAEGDNLRGWLAVVNHAESGSFSLAQAGLLQSIGTILGFHGGNAELYRQQSEQSAGVVRALSSAIDAKDQYTRGHSDRVARIAVRLAQELGWDAKAVETIYLSGLLHDVGKIGVSDHVLHKPGPLTEDECQHVRRHVEIGHRILLELGQFDTALPVALYHHESWDGSGYPYGLAGEAIPPAARIVAVADAYDAMASDRPYRQGLDEAEIEAILRDGAGRQWDPAVIDAFFRVRSDVLAIVGRDARAASAS